MAISLQDEGFDGYLRNIRRQCDEHAVDHHQCPVRIAKPGFARSASWRTRVAQHGHLPSDLLVEFGMHALYEFGALFFLHSQPYEQPQERPETGHAHNKRRPTLCFPFDLLLWRGLIVCRPIARLRRAMRL